MLAATPDLSAVRWRPAGSAPGDRCGHGDRPAVVLLDQTMLPACERDVVCVDVSQLVDAIRRLVVRGAPLLGLAGAYGVALAAHAGGPPAQVRAGAAVLAAARPTAVNLSRGVATALAAYEAAVAAAPAEPAAAGAAAALASAQALDSGGRAESVAMAAHGLGLVPPGAHVLTHCNTGSLAAPGEGTAFAVVVAAARAGRLAHLWVDETRPLRQGARLTAWEATRHGLPYSVLPDAAAGSLLAAGRVDLVVVGADRVAADGSVANKVGTYPLAVLARRHAVPFVVVAPTSTVDLSVPDGSAIPVEHRDPAEVSDWHPRSDPSAPAWSPAFDVTPPDLVTALVTEQGVVSPVDTDGLRRVVSRADGPAVLAGSGHAEDRPVVPSRQATSRWPAGRYE